MHEEYYRRNQLEYYKTYVDQAIKAIKLKQCICFSSYYGCGDKRIADYIAYSLEQNATVTVYNEYPKSFTLETLLGIKEQSVKNPVVIVSQFYEYKSAQYKEAFQELIAQSSGRIISVLTLSSQFLESPSKYFYEPKLYEKTIVTTPLSPQGRVLMFAARQELDVYELTKRTIHKIFAIGGGHPGLLKYLGRLAHQRLPLTYDFVVSEPSIRNILIKMKDEVETLSPEILQRMGILSPYGIITIPLLREFIGTKHRSVEQQLTDVQLKLLALMKAIPAPVVTLSQIHSILSPESDFSLWATYKQIKKFAALIKPHYIIRNVKGKGYMLKLRSP